MNLSTKKLGKSSNKSLKRYLLLGFENFKVIDMIFLFKLGYGKYD